MGNKDKSGMSFDRPTRRLEASYTKMILETPVPSSIASTTYDLTVKEVECARKFNFELPEDLGKAVELMETAVTTLMGSQKNVILIYDEEDGTYTCLNDEKTPERKPRELTQISDGFLQALLESENVIHTFLYSHNALVGIVAVADKTDGLPFDAWDEICLDLVARYLSTKVVAFKFLKESLFLPYIQHVMLEISNQLISAVDHEAIVKSILQSLGQHLGLDVCQYVALDAETGEGNVLYEYQGGAFQSYAPWHGKEERKVVEAFASLVSLFTSIARKNPYLLINGKTLGDKSLSEMFGVLAVESALIVPVMEMATGKLQGTINLFKTQPGIIPSETMEIAKEVTVLASLAMGRASALEKALTMASCDELTGLTNRRGFYERFDAEIERARRNPSSLTVAMMDVDHFKKLNDTYGHLSGDRVLQMLAGLLMKNVRKSDVVCRFGGEEFALLLPDTSLASATELLDRIRRTIEQQVIQGAQGDALTVTISAGLAEVNCIQEMGKPIREIISDALSRADQQLYHAKETGRNQVCAFGEA